METKTPQVDNDKTLIAQILMSELQALHAEATNIASSQGNLGFLAIATCGAALAAAIQFNSSSLIIPLPAIIVAVWSLVITLNLGSLHIGRYLAVTERKINQICGSEVLLWQTRWAGSRIRRRSGLLLGIISYGIALALFLSLLGFATSQLYSSLSSLWSSLQILLTVLFVLAHILICGLDILALFVLIPNWLKKMEAEMQENRFKQM